MGASHGIPFALALLASACAIAPAARDTAPASGQDIAEARGADASETDGASLEDESVDVLPGIPREMNEHVERWISYFAETDRERFQGYLDEGQKYREVVDTILEENGVPAELYYLAIIESGFQTRATSRAKAVGAWQFMKATGKRYGLQSDSYVDERRDPIRATEAAAKYLRDLYNVFGSWYLALAAYNAGEYRIVGAILKGRSRDFWTLHKKGVLPRETANYVPKFLAAIEVGENPSKYQFREPRNERYPSLEAVEVPTPVRLRDVARMTGIPEAELEKVNPHLRRGMTPPGGGTYEIWVPQQYGEAVKREASRLAQVVVRGLGGGRSLASASDPPGKRYYVVQEGDTLSSIARRHQMSVSYLRRINGLRSSRLREGTRLRVAAASYSTETSLRYRVKPGDTLYSIANRFGISVSRLRRLNSLRGSRIHPGQSLRVGRE